MLDNVDVSFFWENGYQTFKNVIDVKTIDKIRDFLSGNLSRQIDLACEELGCNSFREFVNYIEELVRDRPNEIGSCSKIIRDTISGHFLVESRLSPLLYDIVTTNNLKAILSKILLSDKLFLHMPPMARFVLPGNTYSAVPAHQDTIYNTHLSDFVTVWVPLVDIDDKCGGVRVYKNPNLSRDYSELVNGTENFWHKGLETSSYASEHCKIDMGDILVLNKLIVHASEPNLSDHTRFSIDFRFFNEKVLSSKHYLNLSTMEIIAPAEEVV